MNAWTLFMTLLHAYAMACNAWVKNINTKISKTHILLNKVLLSLSARLSLSLSLSASAYAYCNLCFLRLTKGRVLSVLGNSTPRNHHVEFLEF